jgi:hypothetical protein
MLTAFWGNDRRQRPILQDVDQKGMASDRLREQYVHSRVSPREPIAGLSEIVTHVQAGRQEVRQHDDSGGTESNALGGSSINVGLR